MIDIQSYIHTLEQKVQRCLAELNITQGTDCSEVAEYIHDRLHIGRICTIRAFKENGVGAVFNVYEPHGVSEAYFYHTILLHEHAGVSMIIDGTGYKVVELLNTYTQGLYKLNALRYVYFDGVVDAYSLSNVDTYKQKRIFTY